MQGRDREEDKDIWVKFNEWITFGRSLAGNAIFLADTLELSGVMGAPVFLGYAPATLAIVGVASLYLAWSEKYCHAIDGVVGKDAAKYPAVPEGEVVRLGCKNLSALSGHVVADVFGTAGEAFAIISVVKNSTLSLGWNISSKFIGGLLGALGTVSETRVTYNNIRRKWFWDRQTTPDGHQRLNDQPESGDLEMQPTTAPAAARLLGVTAAP